MLLLRSNGTLLHMKDCIITFVKLIISKKHNFILYNALTNRDSPNFPLPSNPLPQIVTSNPRLQPDTHFAVDMFPYKKTGLFQKSGFKSKPPKKPGIYVFNLSYATLDALRKQSFLRLSAAFAAYSPSHNGSFVSKLPKHLMLGLCVAHC